MDKPGSSSDLVKEFECVSCKGNFACDRRDSNVPKILRCETCMEYIRNNHGNICICGRCNEHFEDCSSLETHMACHNIYNTLKCENCRRYFHAGMDQAPDEKNVCRKCKESHAPRVDDSVDVVCGVCEHKLKESTNVGGHLWIHMKDQPYKCGICKVSYILYKHFEEHVRDHFLERT